MLAVITAVAICLVIVNEFGTSTTIDMMQSRNNLDQMRAHFLARSSLNITELIIRLQRRLDNASAASNPNDPIGSAIAEQLKGVQITDFADPLMAAFGGDADQVQAAIGLSMSQTKGLGSDIGTFGVRITPIDGKINVNCAAGSTDDATIVARSLQSLLYPPAFDPIFEEEDADGWRRDRRTQISAIMDYIDKNQSRVEITDDKVVLTGGPEDYGYENLKDTYKAKNDKLDSVSELKLVRGVDDRFWTLFGNAFRVVGGCKVNLRGLDDAKVVAAIISLAAEDKNHETLRNPAMLWALANLVLQAPQYGFYFSGEEGLQTFSDFVKDPAAAFAGWSSAGEGGEGGQQQPSTPGFGAPPIPPDLKGVPLKMDDLRKVALTTPIENYQVEAWGEVTREPFLPARRTVRANWNQTVTLQQKRNDFIKNGSWLYLREE